VGAAIAAGSQLENGIWALFVMAASERHRAAEVFSVLEGQSLIQWF